jgi:hypothetical protein
MRRIAYRFVLPPVQLALYLVLVWHGCNYRLVWQDRCERWIAPHAPIGDRWDPTWIDGPASVAEQLAEGIDAPAALGGALALAPLVSAFRSAFRDGASRELASHAATALFVPFLWYLIGRRLDRRRIVHNPPTVVEKVATVAGLVMAALVTVPIVGSIILTFRFGELLVGRLLILAWAIGGILVASSGIRRWRMRTVVG